MWKRVMVMVAGMSLMTQVLAGNADQGMSGRVRTACDPVCELKAQDSAFALLMETYRQFKSCEIEKNYQGRIEAAVSLPKRSSSPVLKHNSRAMQKLQEFVGALAKEERNLEMEQLQTQVVNFSSAYNCARKLDERYLGQTVTNSVSLRAAAEQLKSFVIVTGGSVGSPSFNKGAPIPADTILMDAEEVAPEASKVIETCE